MAKAKLSNMNIAAWAAGASAIVFVIIGITALLNKTPLQDTRGCRANIEGKTVFIVDQSESLSAQTKTEIHARVAKIIDGKVAVGDLVSVFSISDLSKQNLVPMFSYCKPESTATGPSQSQRHVTANYNKKFAKPLFTAIDSPVIGSTQSPIAQAMVDVSLSDYLKHPTRSRLVVFSDLFEYTDRFKLYACADAKTSVSMFRLSRGASVARPTFANTDVQLHIVPRPHIAAQVGKCRDAFWVWFFTDNEGPGAGFEHFYLPG